MRSLLASQKYDTATGHSARRRVGSGRSITAARQSRAIHSKLRLTTRPAAILYLWKKHFEDGNQTQSFVYFRAQQYREQKRPKWTDIHDAVQLTALTPWSRDFLERPTVAQLRHNSHNVNAECSFPCAQQPATGPYPKPDEFNPQPQP